MKAVILAGGFGTRLSEMTGQIPKPMVEVGGKPMIWHIMNIYSHYGVNEFVVALGYKAEVIKEYFLHFYALNNDITLDLESGEQTIHAGKQPNWKIHLVDTGLDTMTGGRLKRLQKWIGNEAFYMTYGDGVSNVPIDKLLSFHQKECKAATVTAVRPPARFGGLSIQSEAVLHFSEKNQSEEGWINGGFFVLEPSVFDLIQDDSTTWECKPMERLAQQNQLAAYCHEGFWQPMDTLREVKLLESMWKSGEAPWKVWN